MTDADKLKQLIELAWANGWRPDDERQDLIGIELLFIDEDLECSFSRKLCGGLRDHPYLAILFDHNFIKALCIAKSPQCKNCSVPIGYTDTITQLALSTDRINYLYGEFCNDK